MSRKVSFEVTSHKAETLAELEAAIDRSMNAVGVQAQGNAVEEITIVDAVDTGRLRASITYATQSQKGSTGGEALPGDGCPGTPEKHQVLIGTNVEYAAYVEMGTSKMKARPFLKPAIENNLSEYADIIKAALGD